MITHLDKVSFNFIILNGCRHNCNGCTVIKDNNPQISDSDYTSLIALFKEFKDKNVKVEELALGLTDFLSRSNRKELVNDTRLQHLFKEVDNLEINITCLVGKDDELRDMVDDINILPNHLKLELGVPFEYHLRDKDKYKNVLLSNINKLNTLLDNRLEQVRFQINYSQAKYIDQFGFDLESDGFINLLNQEMSDITFVDIALPDLNKNLKDINVRQSLLSTIRKSNDLIYNKLIDSINNKDINWPFPNEVIDTDVGIGLTYYGSELYLFTNVFDNFSTTNDFFKVYKPWTYDNLLRTINDITIKGIEFSTKTKDCSACPYLLKCSSKGTLGLMQVANYKECISLYPRLEPHLDEYRNLYVLKDNQWT